MALVAYVSCGLESEERTGDGMNPIRKTKGLNRKSLFEREWVRVCVHARGEGSASQMRMLCELTCNYRLRLSIVSQLLIGTTRGPIENEQRGHHEDN